MSSLHPTPWPFEPGTLKATGRNKGKVVATHELRTAGKPAKIVLAADRAKLFADFNDLAYVNATMVDKSGIPVPDATNLITFKLSGPGLLAGFDSGDNNSHEPFQSNERHAFNGQCFAILKAINAPGRATLPASAPGLTPARISITTLTRPKGID